MKFDFECVKKYEKWSWAANFLKKSRGRNLIFLLFIVAGFALYANTFNNKMFWDDEDVILKNQFIQDWQYVPKYFSDNLIAGSGLISNYWRPALLSIFSLEWHLWGNWPAGYHFVNMAFHIADATLLFLVLSYLFKNRWLAIFTALIFLVHPLQTEAVTYVSGLSDPLATFLMLAGLLFYLKFRLSKKPALESHWYFLTLLIYILALMTKETAVILPALIFICDFFWLGQEPEQLAFAEKLKKTAKAVWPFFVIAGLYILARGTILNFQNTFNLYDEQNIFTSNFYIRLLTFFRIMMIYLGLLFWPFNLHMERSVTIATSLHSWPVIFGGVIFLSLLILALTQFKRWPVLSFGILWFFIGIAPNSNLVIPINGLLFEHWLYLPMIGIFMAVIWLGISAARRFNLQKIFLLILAIFLIFLSVLTINRNKDWADPIIFYNQTLKYAPTSYRVINNLGMAYADAGDYERAKQTYQKAIELYPAQAVAYHNLGNLYKANGQTNLAIDNFKAAISLDPKFFFSYNILAGLYLENKNYQEARKVLENYLNYSGLKTDTLFLLAQIAMEEGDLKAALAYLEKFLAIDPGNRMVQNAILQIRGF